VSTQSFVLSTDGVRIALHDLGGPDDLAAPVVLFSHATGFHGRVWEPMALHLTDRFRCLALDYRGHGLSETPDEAGLAWSKMGDDAEAVLLSDLVGPEREVHGIGHSMGGAALVLAAGRRPGFFRSLWLYEPVIVGPGVWPGAGSPNPMADAAARRRSTFSSYEAARHNFSVKPPLDQLHPDAMAAYVNGGFALQADGSVTLRCAPRTEAAVFRGAAESGAWNVLPALDVPVAVVAGRRDEAGPQAFVAPTVERLRRGTLVDRPHLGHFGPLEDPSGVARDVASWVGRWAGTAPAPRPAPRPARRPAHRIP
jgi:pimeloyl-ACP methyl ester carboxylesterase